MAAHRPWTIAGGPDPQFDDAARTRHHLLLTDANLLTCFRRHFPAHEDSTYDEMVRLLGYVWDCAHDGAAAVTGFLCPACGASPRRN